MQQDSTISYVLGMAVYYGIFLFLTALVLAKSAEYIDDNFVLVVSGILLFCIAAFRMPGVDRDSLTYIESFESFKGPLDYFTHHGDWFFFEPFYYLVPSIAKLFFGNTVYVVITFAFFAACAILFTFKATKKLSPFPELSILVYFGGNFIVHEMTQIRVGVVCGLFLFAIYYHFHKKYKLFALTVLVGLLFHYTAILMLVLLLLNPVKFNTRLYIVIFLASIGVTFFGTDAIIAAVFKFNFPFIQKMAVEFAHHSVAASKGDPFQLPVVNVLLTVWLWINHKKIQEKCAYSNLLLKLQALSIISIIVFSSIGLLAFRISEFLGIVNIITIPLVVYTFRSRLVGYSVTFGYALLILVLNLQFGGLIKPYKMVF